MSSQVNTGKSNQARALLKANSSWASLSEELPLGLILLDDRGQIVSINRQALKIFDLNRTEIVLVGDNEQPSMFVASVSADEKDYWQRQIMMVMATGEPIDRARYFHHTGYAQKILTYKISRIMPQQSANPLLAIVAWDVTDQVAREKYVILSEKLVARGEMAATIASNLERHLGGMADIAQLIQSSADEGKTEAIKFNAGAILENIDSIRTYIRERLDYSEPETAFILYDTRLLIEDMLMTVSKKPRFRDVVFTVDLAADMPLIEMDVGQIQYLLKNLLNNAADTLEEKRQISEEPFEKQISVEAVWNSVTERISVIVTDNGMGISKGVQKKMYNLHFSTKKISHGLGLYRCQQVVRQHDGQLVVDSTVGEGTSFTIVFPRLSRS